MNHLSFLNIENKEVFCVKSFDFSSSGEFEATFLFLDERETFIIEEKLAGYSNDLFLLPDRLQKLLDGKIKNLLWFMTSNESHQIVIKELGNDILYIKLTIQRESIHKFQFHFEYEFKMSNSQVLCLLDQFKLLLKESMLYN